jgi:hypothetical protein
MVFSPKTAKCCTQIGDDRFTWFGTRSSKTRLNFLDLLRAGHTDYVLNDAAFEYLCSRGLAGPLIPSLACSLARLADAGVTSFANNAAWEAHLDQLGNHRARKRGRSSRCRLTALRGIGPLRVPILCR